ncbi:MAG: hypothetical protein M1820_009530 [Bogoriella megaspora]|nr:MAG: hypothetical protein M1820_009530 [Bogoriella megaspora]
MSQATSKPVGGLSQCTSDVVINIDDRPFRFLELPAEIRNLIYELLLISARQPVPMHKFEKSSGVFRGRYDFPGRLNPENEDWPYGAIPVNILATCRQINKEAAPILYGKNVFSVQAVSYRLPREAYRVPAGTVAAFEKHSDEVKHLEIEIGVVPYYSNKKVVDEFEDPVIISNSKAFYKGPHFRKRFPRKVQSVVLLVGIGSIGRSWHEAKHWKEMMLKIVHDLKDICPAVRISYSIGFDEDLPIDLCRNKIKKWFDEFPDINETQSGYALERQSLWFARYEYVVNQRKIGAFDEDSDYDGSSWQGSSEEDEPYLSEEDLREEYSKEEDSSEEDPSEEDPGVLKFLGASKPSESGYYDFSSSSDNLEWLCETSQISSEDLCLFRQIRGREVKLSRSRQWGHRMCLCLRF